MIAHLHPKLAEALVAGRHLIPWAMVSSPGDELERFLLDLRDDDFDGSGVHDWRRYIPTEVEACWRDLNDDVRVVAFLIAEECADREVWN